jgi:FAD/FMN-containing dehydrogenase/Fe-S oxidoreductase
MIKHLQELETKLSGELYYDKTMRILYATDASVYREMPLAVALPKDKKDIRVIVAFANQHEVPLIPRAAGTSLAGQCVGTGLVVDVSKYMNQILEVNTEKNWVKVQPGVIRDELNQRLEKDGLFFGPDTSTVNRCMMGGMVGNNSCGSTSIVYGSTRDHLLEVDVILSDGTETTFKALSKADFYKKIELDNLEGEIYRHIHTELSNTEQQKEIRAEFPKASIHRRNTGYAVDVLLETDIFTKEKPTFNFCSLMAGSEGTLAFMTEIKLNCVPLPPKHKILLCAHFESVQESLEAVLIAMKYQPTAVELMDKIIMDCTKESIEYRKNRFFLEGDPQAVLVIQFSENEMEKAEATANELENAFKNKGYGYAFPRVRGSKMKQVWDLRKAGLGLLANIPGDSKAVAVIEDTAVDVQDLPAYIQEISAMMTGFGQRSVYYAHAGAGELHLRPILNLKKSEDVQLFHDIGEATAKLVKKYDGSLSGEHGDGRVRAEFIPLMIGEKNYDLIKRLKYTWDPKNLFNPGKIVDAPPMNTSLRYEPDAPTPELETVFNFSETGGIIRAAEKCNGSGDCRKLPLSGGTMCPSYRATRDEKSTTRGRANVLREMLTNPIDKNKPFDSQEIYEVLDLCVSCKGCTSECPSNVDMSTMKAEFLHQYHQTHGIPLRSLAFSYISNLNALGSIVPSLTNFIFKNKYSNGLLKKVLKVAPERDLPLLHSTTLRKWFRKNAPKVTGEIKKTVYLFCDEFTNYNDTEIGIRAVQLLTRLGYEVKMVKHSESGRSHISKGVLKPAQALARKNIAIFKNIITKETPLLGIEPSAILSFRDEYPRLVADEEIETAKQLAKNVLLVDEFISQEIMAGNITADIFTKEKKTIKLHGHCHQKALSSVNHSAWLVGLPENYTVEVIPSGCCGMAGSFGYEAEHYEVSMKIGEQTLFPAVRSASADTIIAAPGTSCRHQIKDGTKREALHPVEVLWEALR